MYLNSYIYIYIYILFTIKHNILTIDPIVIIIQNNIGDNITSRSK